MVSSTQTGLISALRQENASCIQVIGLFLYGTKEHLKDLDERRANHTGEIAHEQAIEKHAKQKEVQSPEEK